MNRILAEILNLPQHELDRAIATEVMGWYQEDSCWVDDASGTLWFSSPQDDDDGVDYYFSPTSNFRMAMDVLVKLLSDKKWTWHAEAATITEGDRQFVSFWVCLEYDDPYLPEEIEFYDFEHESLPYAISAIALWCVRDNVHNPI